MRILWLTSLSQVFLPSLLILASDCHEYEIFIIQLTNYVHAVTAWRTVACENTNEWFFGTQITNELTNSIAQSPSEASSFLSTQEIPRMLWNTKFHYPFLLTFCWPCISIYLFLNINQLDALNFIISLFQASTCFKHMCSSSGGQKLYYTVSGIITLKQVNGLKLLK